MKQKNVITIAVVVGLIVLAIVVFGRNSSNNTNSTHTHQYVETVVNATCLESGYNLFVCECGDSYKGNAVYEKTGHSGSVTCTKCGLNYFDELKSLIIQKGTISGGSYYYLGQTRTDDDVEQSTYVSYDPSDMTIYIGLIYEWAGLATYSFLIEIAHPSENTGLATGKFDWVFVLNDDAAVGTLNGATFSKLTEELSISYNDGFASSNLSSVRSLAASFAHYAINDAFLPLLRLGDKGITPKDLGFVNYSL